jgi:hypothetical protein
MKNVDTSKVWQGKRKPEKLEMKGFSPTQSIEPAKKEKDKNREKQSKSVKSTMKLRHHATMPSSNHAIMTSSMTSRHLDVIIEKVRKTVKVIGKEPSTHRLTPEEKKAIIEIVYAYKSQGIKTSENEVARIAINFLVNDYKENGENSILHKVIKALNE